MTDLKNIERCVLCLDEKLSPVRIQCGHSFCNECLSIYKSYHKYAWANKCPICRCHLKEKQRTPKIRSPNTSVNNPTHHGTARTSGVSTATGISMDQLEQTCILEELIAIATDQDDTPSSMESEDVEMEEINDDEIDENNYFSNSNGDSYYYFEGDEDVEDYEAEVVGNSEFTILSHEGGNWSGITTRSGDIDIDIDIPIHIPIPIYLLALLIALLCMGPFLAAMGLTSSCYTVFY